MPAIPGNALLGGFVSSGSEEGGGGSTDFAEILASLGLTTSLEMCLDAGDLDSYAGTGQTWLDTTANDNDFYRGTTSSSQSSDPTFNGVAGSGAPTNYWSFDGNDYFTKASANSTFINSIHKDNAVFTILQVTYANGLVGSSTYGSVGTVLSGSSAVGFSFGHDPTETDRTMSVYIWKGSSTAMSYTTTATVTNNSWNMVALSLTEATGAGSFVINGTTEALTGKTYTSPSSASATNTLQVGAAGGNDYAEKSGNRWAIFAVWSRALSSSELASIYTAIQTQFGLP